MKNDFSDAAPSPLNERAFRYSKPTKEAVRRWLFRVIAARRPPPSMDEIRDELWCSPQAQGIEGRER